MKNIQLEIVSDLLGVQLEKSEVLNSLQYKEIEKELSTYNGQFLDKIGDELFSEYRELRIDIEALHYKFGFLDGVRFTQTISGTPPQEIIEILAVNKQPLT